ncbi:MAG: glycoside hydrolase family 25 protein [Clostridium sp.]|nr:glycoside hydrolase family 25 protein [Clostridium sp.]MCM1547870.1 glycoside hydrolase family 25 protein [Ruminococcus sp.]
MSRIILRKRHKLSVVIVILLSLTYFFGVLWYNGIIWLNTPSKSKYPVRGIDVSSYQGVIDWEKIERQKISFAFIKATEGSGFTDEYFAENYKNSAQTDIRIGAYHFFSFDSPGKTQAENFIKTVEKRDNMLPPVIDVEYYNGNGSDPPNEEKARQNLNDLIYELKSYYGMEPIIYATDVTYNRYIKNHFENNDIWIRSVFTEAALSDDREWTFWQYCNRGRLDGYDGVEKFIDLDVFNGTKEEFESYRG